MKVSSDLMKVSPDLKKVSPDLMKASPDLKKVSPDLIKVSHHLKKVSPDHMKVSHRLKKVKVSTDFKKVSLDLKVFSDPKKVGFLDLRCLPLVSKEDFPDLKKIFCFSSSRPLYSCFK